MQEKTQKKSTIKQNILHYIDYKGITRYEFYKKSGITRGVLDQNNGMSEENTARFLANYPEVSIEWLLTGAGNMLKSNDNQSLISACAERDRIIESKEEIIATQKKLIASLERELGKWENAIEMPAPEQKKRAV
jgi:hypothetical protein